MSHEKFYFKMCDNVKCVHYVCGKEFGSADLLRRQEKNHTNNYVCQDCVKKYSSKQAFEYIKE